MFFLCAKNKYCLLYEDIYINAIFLFYTFDIAGEYFTMRKFKFENDEKLVCILINRQGRVCYSNISKDAVGKWLEDFRIIDYLPIDDTVSFNVGYCTITADKIVLNEEKYYLILIQSHGYIYRYAYRDSVTGLYNRNFWEHLISGVLQYPMPPKFTLIVIDIDNLKSINDNKGHLTGDKAIRIVGQAIRESIRKRDLGVRYGGDEFFILLANTKKIVADKVINRIRENISKKEKKENINIEISAGAACYDCVYDMGDIIKMADRNLYKEKQMKKTKEKQNSDKLKHLLMEIEKLRDELNKKVSKESQGINNEETLKVSEKLDELIIRYLIDE